MTCLWVGLVSGWSGEVLPDFRLTNVNPNSVRYRQQISPRDYLLQVTGYYFSGAGCSYCRAQFTYLETLQTELRAAQPELNIELMGVNRTNDAVYNFLAVSGRKLPWLQDDAANPEARVWERWKPVYRDVFIVDAQNILRGTYNLSQHDLADPIQRGALKDMLLAVARATDTDGDHLWDDWELLHFKNLAARADEDADQDGATNFEEQALGSDPRDPASRPAWQPRLGIRDGKPHFSVLWRRPAGRLADYQFELSSDLKTWKAEPAGFSSAAVLNNLFDGHGNAEETVWLAAPVSDHPMRFIRMRPTPRDLGR